MSTAAFYDRWAALYDRIATAPGIGRWRARAAGRVGSPGTTVLEVGCGTGANLPYLRERVGPTGRVVGIDVAGRALERARERVAGYDNVAVVRADAAAPPVGAVDGVLAAFVCGFFEDAGAVVEAWCDRLAPGGRIALLAATASESPLGRPLNPLFRAFVAAGSPSGTVRDALAAPFDRADEPLTRRVEAARAALRARAVGMSYETFGLGFVGLAAGEVP